MKKRKLPKSLLFAMAVVVSGIAAVSADSSASSALVTISSGSYSDITMNCNNNGHQGGAKATATPGTGVYLNWKLAKKVVAVYVNQKEQNITGLSTSNWSWTSRYSVGTGNFRHRFTAKGGSYTGNIEGLNYS